MSEENRRILLIDDSPSIHEDFRKILVEGGKGAGQLGDAKAAFFGEDEAEESTNPVFELDSAYQGQEGLEMLVEANRSGLPYAMAFVDVRMPPGWDGIQTIKHLWEVAPELHIVICTAYSDYSWDQTIRELGQSERLLILKKPFDSVEIRQLAHALTDKVNTASRERTLIDNLKEAEAEARSYAASVETMNQALKTAKATADKASEMKGEFLLHLSHQVNTNLTTILDRVEELGDTTGLVDVLDSSRQLMRTLNEILDITQIESGNIEIVSEPCKLHDAVREVIGEHLSSARAKGLTLTAAFPEALPESVRTDEVRLKQILVELVGNAIRNTASGSVTVTVRMEPTNDWQQSIVSCAVTDTGRGISSDMQGWLFEPFGGSSAGGNGRPGLGLALSKQLARLLGGDVAHEDRPGDGRRFHSIPFHSIPFHSIPFHSIPFHSIPDKFTLSLTVGNMSGVPMVDGSEP